MRALGINAIFHDPSAALVADGKVVTAADEERFTRRKHGRRPVAFAAWELPKQSARWCLAEAGLTPAEVDAVGYSCDPSLVPTDTSDPWDWLRTLHAQRASLFLATAPPGLDLEKVHYVPHHVAHAASVALPAPLGDCVVLVADGRGEAASYLAGVYRDGVLTTLARIAGADAAGLAMGVVACES